jgi:hypothetical protein
VFPEADAIKAFVEATHPMQLVNYGNRAWCRLEVYVFSCLVEIMGREITCFAYGLHMPKLKAGEEISEELMVTGKSGRGAASTFSGSFVNFFLKPSSKERLVPLFGHNNGALFAKTYMPSSGDLTVEDDRSVVHGIEQVIQQSYSTMAIKKAIDWEAHYGTQPSMMLNRVAMTAIRMERSHSGARAELAAYNQHLAAAVRLHTSGNGSGLPTPRLMRILEAWLKPQPSNATPD